MLQWILYSEAHPMPTPRLQSLVRLQNLVNVLYYPLEHTYWLALHKVVDISDEKRDVIGMWSCRFWAAYVALYFVQLWEEAKELKKRMGVIKKEQDEDKRKVLKKQLRRDQVDWVTNVVVNAAYFPLTLHWSVPNSSFPDVAVGVCGTIAAVAQMMATWKST